MKVYIGPYKSWIGPYQLAELFKYIGVSDDTCYSIGNYLSKITFLVKFCEFVEKHRKRKVKVHIHNYDVWNMDSTLAMIILPMLFKLKEAKHGAPCVDNSDVPEELRSISTDDYGTEPTHFKKWDWVMDELIWVFTVLQPDYDEDQHYATGTIDLSLQDSYLKEGPKHTYKIDEDKMKEHYARVNNGLRLFGKYYRNLWD